MARYCCWGSAGEAKQGEVSDRKFKDISNGLFKDTSNGLDRQSLFKTVLLCRKVTFGNFYLLLRLVINF